MLPTPSIIDSGVDQQDVRGIVDAGDLVRQLGTPRGYKHLTRLCRQADTEGDQNGTCHGVEYATDPCPLHEWSDPVEDYCVDREPAKCHETKHRTKRHECRETARGVSNELRKQTEEESRHLGVGQVADKTLADCAARSELWWSPVLLLGVMVTANCSQDRLHTEER